MGKRITENLSIGNAKIIFRNFRGEGNDYNMEGNRNFSVVIDDPKVADNLKKEGWNIKPLRSRDPEDDPAFHLPVAVRFDKFPPVIWSIKSGRKVQMNEKNVQELDYADIKNIDLIIRPSNWERNGKSGVKAYLRTMYVEIEQDEFAAKYEDPIDDDMPF